jgi:hypothetical protein
MIEAVVSAQALSGHGIGYCRKIIETYLPRPTEVALSAIKVSENSTDTAKVVHLPSRRNSDNQ